MSKQTLKTDEGDKRKKKGQEEVTLGDIVTLFGSYATLPASQHNVDGMANVEKNFPQLLIWLNEHLSKKGIELTEVKGFGKGIELIYLIESLTNSVLVSNSKNANPTSWSEMQTNCELLVRFAKHHGISTDKLTADDIQADNVPKILLLIVRAAIQVHASESALDSKDLKKKKKESPANVEIKLDQATVDGILKDAATRESKRSQDEKDKKEDEKKRKGPTAMELISGDMNKKFTIIIEGGGKKQVPFKALQPIEDPLKALAAENGLALSDFTVTTTDGRPLSLQTKMGEIKDFAVKFASRTDALAKLAGDSGLSEDKARALKELLGSEQVQLSGVDKIAEEAAERLKTKENPSLRSQHGEPSPALRELERQHKALLKTLRVKQISIVDKIGSDEIQADISKVDPTILLDSLADLYAFADKLGTRDIAHEPKDFFGDLVKVPNRNEILSRKPDEVSTPHSSRETQTSSRKGDKKTTRNVSKREVDKKEEKKATPAAPVKEDDDDDDDPNVQYPATFLIQLETGGRSLVPFQKTQTVRQGIEKIASQRGIKVDEWMFVTLSGQPVDLDTQMGKVPGFSVMCVRKS